MNDQAHSAIYLKYLDLTRKLIGGILIVPAYMFALWLNTSFFRDLLPYGGIPITLGILEALLILFLFLFWTNVHGTIRHDMRFEKWFSKRTGATLVLCILASLPALLPVLAFFVPTMEQILPESDLDLLGKAFSFTAFLWLFPLWIGASALVRLVGILRYELDLPIPDEQMIRWFDEAVQNRSQDQLLDIVISITDPLPPIENLEQTVKKRVNELLGQANKGSIADYGGKRDELKRVLKEIQVCKDSEFKRLVAEITRPTDESLKRSDFESR